MKRGSPAKAWWTGGVLSVLFLGTLGVSRLGAATSAGPEREAPAPAPGLAAPPHAPAKGPSGSLTPASRGYPGVVLARDAVDLAPKVEGSLVGFRVNLGDHVARGDVLANVDVASVRQELLIAQARLRGAQADRAKALAERSQAQERRTRNETLADQLSVADLQAARYQHQLAVAALSFAQARVAESEARVRQLQEQVDDGQMRAPFDGIVTERYLAPGARVGRQTPILRLIGREALSVRFAVPGEELGKLSPGAPVRVEIEQPELTLEGEVQSVSGELDPATQTLVAEAKLRGGSEVTVPSGQSARIFLLATRRADRKR